MKKDIRVPALNLVDKIKKCKFRNDDNKNWDERYYKIEKLENIGKQKNFIKKITRKINSQEGGLLINFLPTLITVVLPLKKNVLTLAKKSVLMPLGLTEIA